METGVRRPWPRPSKPSLSLRVTGAPSGDDLSQASDHGPFGSAGIPWLFLFAGTHADYHQVTDEADLVNFDKAAEVARLGYRIVLSLAGNAAPGPGK